MQYTTLPNTDIKISKICLGTMTWGEQNTEAEAHEQMDYALDQGVNFFDTAELYSVPARAETYGSTERFIGSWFAKTGNRDKVILASKIAGPGPYTQHVRTTGFSKEALHEAVDNSLKRLQTDHIDLYQLHWPERSTNFFGARDYNHAPTDPWTDNFHEILENLGQLVKSGKIGHIGLSNEVPWGVMRYLEESKKNSLPRMITIQNPYSLLNRTFEGGNAEVSIRENIGLLAYSPLGGGVLSGKYLGGKKPAKARGTLFPNFVARYKSQQSLTATQKYADLAKSNGLSLAQMALSFVNTRPFLTSNIIGATNLEQLKENIDSTNVHLSDEVLKAIDAIHNEVPNPAP